MARRNRDEDLLMEDELTAAFLGEDDAPSASAPVEETVAIAEEWEAQQERIDMKSLKLNKIISTAVRTSNDPQFQSYMRD